MGQRALRYRTPWPLVAALASRAGGVRDAGRWRDRFLRRLCVGCLRIPVLCRGILARRERIAFFANGPVRSDAVDCRAPVGGPAVSQPSHRVWSARPAGVLAPTVGASRLVPLALCGRDIVDHRRHSCAVRPLRSTTGRARVSALCAIGRLVDCGNALRRRPGPADAAGRHLGTPAAHTAGVRGAGGGNLDEVVPGGAASAAGRRRPAPGGRQTARAARRGALPHARSGRHCRIVAHRSR